jgi:hypothetical protein
MDTVTFSVGLAIRGRAVTGDADASMAIIVINMEVVTPSASNFCVRCDVVVVNIFLSEPLFMRNKFPDPHHAHLYGDSTIAQLCLIPRSPGIIDWHFPLSLEIMSVILSK